MKYSLFILLLISFDKEIYGQTKKGSNKAGKQQARIQFNWDALSSPDSMAIGLRADEVVDPRTSLTRQKKKIETGTVTWTIDCEKPVRLYVKELPDMHKRNSIHYLVEAGDNVIISAKDGKLIFSGKGAEKMKLRYELEQARISLKKPLPVENIIDSINAFFVFNKYLDSLEHLYMPILEAYKGNKSSYTYNKVKSLVIGQVLDDRSDVFGALMNFVFRNKMSNSLLCKYYDSIYYPAVNRWYPYVSLYSYATSNPVKYHVLRSLNFDWENEIFKNQLSRHVMYLQAGLSTLTGLAREKFIQDFFGEQFVEEKGFIPETESFLVKYYAEKEYPEYKKYMKEFELKYRKLHAGYAADNFELWDTRGNRFTKENIKGKVAVIDFWFTGCIGCIQMAPALKKVEEHFKNDTNVVFLKVSVDEKKEQWLASIDKAKYTSKDGIHLYTGGEGSSHIMLTRYTIDEYPEIRIIDPFGALVLTNPFPDPRKDEGKQLISLIEQKIILGKDGPYVLYSDTGSSVYSITGASFFSVSRWQNKDIPPLQVQTDQSATFTVALKKNEVEPAEFAKPSKLLAFSDIEGNFDALHKLLEANGVIDQQYNWTFGTGHLVFAGDMFDRGPQVTECLWLLYSLEEKAKAVGGYVHFILGNHEIMNLQGDHSYAVPKYISNAKMLGTTLQQLYNENSELGRWLRTKNVIEKIGDLLFLHGGVSGELNRLPLTLTEINALARMHYAEAKNNYGNESSNTIMSTKVGPFWYREYYKNGNLSGTIDSTLQKFAVARIVTGHTIIADTISVHFNGKVINTDTHHKEGKSEALLVEGNAYFRTNAEGTKKIMIMGRRNDETAASH